MYCRALDHRILKSIKTFFLHRKKCSALTTPDSDHMHFNPNDLLQRSYIDTQVYIYKVNINEMITKIVNTFI